MTKPYTLSTTQKVAIKKGFLLLPITYSAGWSAKSFIIQTTLSLLPAAKTARRQMGHVEFSDNQRSMQ